MQTLVQNNMVVSVMKPNNWSSSSASVIHTGAATRFQSMRHYSRAHFIINTGSMTEATTNFRLYQSKAAGLAPTNSSISTTALTMTHYWTNKASIAGAYVRTTASSSQITVDSTNSATYIVEVEDKALNAQSSYDAVAIAVVASTISAAANFQATAILSGTRYARDPLPAANTG